VIFITGILAGSCSVEKNTSATRNFHNLTSHYNIYFNATESYKQGLIRAEESYMNDFTSILPLFYYEDESVQQNIASQMKRAIEKSSKVITFHSITAKPKVNKGRQSEKDKAFYDKNEYNKWVDDCYLLIGKSYMYQGEFFTATESFKHVISSFPDEETSLVAKAWLVRANGAIGELKKAGEILDELETLDDFPKKYREDFYTSAADYYIRMEQYGKAAEYLEKALDTRPKKNRRIRYTFILAQLYEEDGNGNASIANYKKVIRMNPPYVMAFNSKVNMAEAFEAGSSGSEEIKKILNKMLKDSKNKEYRDQIYYALANIAMEEGEKEKAIEYYHLSVSTSVMNNYQKGESCLTLADIYYKEPVYTLSAAYYDTAVNLLSADYPGYANLSIRSRSLNNLVRNINTFELQDSVQKLAAMSEVERFQVIDGIIEDLRKKEEEDRLRQMEAMQDLQFSRSGMMDNSGGYGGNTQSTGKWYFYNLSAKSFGQPEFRMKWGERKLEDNWRRSNKQSVSELIEEEGEEGVNGENGGGTLLDNKSREFYLKNIPLTDSSMEVSHLKLEDALYNMGMIYRDDLLDYMKAIEALEELVQRYPDGKLAMPAYYYLHDLYNTIQQPARAEQYKNLLSRKYPDSHMAKLLTNPDYIKELDAENRKIENFYENVYDQYKQSRYSQVIRLAEQGMRDYPKEEALQARLAYLRALSLGGTQGKEVMKTELDSIMARYPETEVAAEAKEIIDYMYVAFPVIKEAEQAREAVEIYTFNPVSKHKFILALAKGQNLNLVRFNLLNYNLDNFNKYDLKIEMKNLEVDYNLLVVGEFNNFEGAKRYGDKVNADITEVIGEMDPSLYKTALISEENYNKLLEIKEVKPYLLFFLQNYPH